MNKYQQKKLDWQSKEVVNVFDEASLWAAPFGRMMLENIPMKPACTVVDIGFGLGFPLIELAQRFGVDSKIYGVDIWEEGIKRAKEKIKVFGLNNISIFEQSATQIPLTDEVVDLITSNLGVNNFEEKELVLAECYRVLKEDGKICITTNPIGTFAALFTIFQKVLEELELKESLKGLQDYLNHRQTQVDISTLFKTHGFQTIRVVENHTFMRFSNAKALLNHGLIRIGFLASWLNLVDPIHHNAFFEGVENHIQQIIDRDQEFRMGIPMLYMEFEKL